MSSSEIISILPLLRGVRSVSLEFPCLFYPQRANCLYFFQLASLHACFLSLLLASSQACLQKTVTDGTGSGGGQRTYFSGSTYLS